MAEKAEKTKQEQKVQLHTTEPGKNQEVFTPRDLLCGLSKYMLNRSVLKIFLRTVTVRT